MTTKKKSRKSRVCFVLLNTWATPCANYCLPVPLDKKRRVIPSSVDCAFNTEYHSQDDVAMALRATI
jgi:hypothetical protein